MSQQNGTILNHWIPGLLMQICSTPSLWVNRDIGFMYSKFSKNLMKNFSFSFLLNNETFVNVNMWEASFVTSTWRRHQILSFFFGIGWYRLFFKKKKSGIERKMILNRLSDIYVWTSHDKPYVVIYVTMNTGFMSVGDTIYFVC